jgi:hypothetical protein
LRVASLTFVGLLEVVDALDELLLLEEGPHLHQPLQRAVGTTSTTHISTTITITPPLRRALLFLIFAFFFFFYVCRTILASIFIFQLLLDAVKRGESWGGRRGHLAVFLEFDFLIGLGLVGAPHGRRRTRQRSKHLVVLSSL